MTDPWILHLKGHHLTETQIEMTETLHEMKKFITGAYFFRHLNHYPGIKRLKDCNRRVGPPTFAHDFMPKNGTTKSNHKKAWTKFELRFYSGTNILFGLISPKTV